MASVRTDESFQIPSPSATAAVETAKKMSDYLCNDVNRDMVREYCENLYDMLAGCLSGKYKRSQYQREKMWTKYHELRTSDGWINFTSAAAGTSASPIFYQYVGNKLLQILITEFNSIHSHEEEHTQVQPLSYHDCNVLRAGKSIRTKIVTL